MISSTTYWQCLQFSSFPSDGLFSSGSTATSSPFPLLKDSMPFKTLPLPLNKEIFKLDEAGETDDEVWRGVGDVAGVDNGDSMELSMFKV